MSVDLGTARGQIVIDTKGVETAMRQAGASMSKFKAGATVAMAGVAAATGAMAAAVKVAQKAWESFERGADLAAAQSRFERLTESINSTSDAMLGRLREATNGMMSDAALIASANDIMSLGLAKTEDQTVRLATVVGKLGWDMQQTILTFANNSKLRLDALGLSIEDVNARTKALQAQGMSLDAAFDLAVIEAGEAKIKLLGDASQTTAGHIKILKSAVENVQNEFSRGLVEAYAGSMEDAAQSAQALSAALGGMAYSAGLATQYLPRISDELIRMLPYLGTFLDFASAIGLTQGYKLQAEAAEQAQAAMADAEKAATVAFNRTAKAARNANTEYAQAARLLDEYGAAANRVTRELELHYNRGDAAAARNRQILADTGKTVYELAQMGLTAEQYLEQTSEAAAAAAEAAAERYHAAFAAVQGDYATALQNADMPLVSPQQDVSIVTRVSGPTEQQAQLAARYREEIERLQTTYNELTAGIGTFGMEQDKLTERITETAYEIAHYENLLAGIPATVENVSTQHQGLAVNMDAVNQAIYDQLAAMPGAEEEAIAFASAVGIMSDEQAEAALQAAAVRIKIEELAEAIAGGLSIDSALTQLQKFVNYIETGVNPALGTAPATVTDFKDEMQEGGRVLGESIPTGLDTGIRENLDTAETAAGDMATAVIDAINDKFGIESPSTVTWETGANLLLGLSGGMEEGAPAALELTEAIGGNLVEAWQETVALMPQIGVDIMDGIIWGVESKRGELAAKMEEIAYATFQAGVDAIDAHSPSRLFMEMGDAIIGGIMVGIDRERERLMAQLDKLGDDMKEQRDRIMRELADLDAMGLMRRLTRAGGGLLDIGNRVFDLQADALAGQIETAAAGLDQALGALSPFASDAVIGNLRDMTPAQQAEALRGLRGRSAFQGDPEAARRLEEAIRLADERNRLEQEHIRQQEELKRLEEQRAQLDFLKTQVDLLNLIRDNGLDASILDGLTLGLDANMGDIIAAMTAAVEQLVERTSDELGIASPSKVFMEIGANVMAGFAEGLRETAAAEAMVRQAMSDVAAVGAIEGARTAAAVTDSIEKGLAYTGSATDRLRELAGGLGRSGLADPRRLEARLREAAGRVIRVDARGLNPAQTVNIYGGYNVQLRDRASAEPLRELYYEGLGYQG